MERQQVGQINKSDPQQVAKPSAGLVTRSRASVHPLLRFRQAIGNQAFGRIIQAKLRIGQTGDGYEQEADRVAEQVMGIPEPEVSDKTETSDQTQDILIQRFCPECEDELRKQSEEGKEKEDVIQTKLLIDNAESKIQRQDEPEEEEIIVQTKPSSVSATRATTATPIVYDVLRSPGRPLDADKGLHGEALRERFQPGTYTH